MGVKSWDQGLRANLAAVFISARRLHRSADSANILSEGHVRLDSFLVSQEGTTLEPMDAHIYKKIELTGTSPNSVEEAVQNAITKAGESVREMKWFELSELRGDISDNKVAHWQATIKVGFRLDG